MLYVQRNSLRLTYEYDGCEYVVTLETEGEYVFRANRPGRKWMYARTVLQSFQETDYGDGFVLALQTALRLLEAKVGSAYGIPHLRLSNEDREELARRADIKIL